MQVVVQAISPSHGQDGGQEQKKAASEHLEYLRNQHRRSGNPSVSRGMT